MMLRHATRANVGLILKIIQATRRVLGGDLEASLIFAAVSSANVGQVEDDPRLALQYAHVPVPDDLRRPIRIQRLADSLDLPRETTRMKVRSLVDGHFLIDTSEGLLMAEGPLRSPQFQAMFGTYIAALGGTIGQLASVGACGLEPGERLAPAPYPAMWSSVRQVTQHALRGIVLLRQHVAPANLFQSFLVQAMIHQTGWGLTPLRLASEPEPDAGHTLRCSASALAAFTGYPRETVRRNLKILTEAGWLVQDRRGFGVGAPLTEEEAVRERQGHERGNADLVRLIRRLRHVGAIVTTPDR